MSKIKYITKKEEAEYAKAGTGTFSSLSNKLKKLYRVRCGKCKSSLKYSNAMHHMRKIHKENTDKDILVPLLINIKIENS